jgi:hypothetical protein
LSAIALSHTTGWGLSEIEKMEISEFGWWCENLKEYHKLMNAAGKEK